jgi:hypothetical protein
MLLTPSSMRVIRLSVSSLIEALSVCFFAYLAIRTLDIHETMAIYMLVDWL